jgi:hypothetical protein
MAQQDDHHELEHPWSRFPAADSHTSESSGASRFQQPEQPTDDPFRWASEEGTSPRAPLPQPIPEDHLAAHAPSKGSRPSFPPTATISSSRMPQYTSRDVGDPSQIKKNKQSMADLKLRRLTELNSRLREDLDRERIPVSQASKR